MRGAAQKQRTALGNIAESGQAVPHAGPVLPRVAFSYLPGEPCLPEWENARVGQETPQSPRIRMEMSRNVQSGNTQNLKSMVIQRSFPKWSVAERRKTAAASDQAAVCACAHSRYFTGGSPSGLRV